MTVRPKDLKPYNASVTVLHCGDCVVDFSARPADYDWMFPGDAICCQQCGGELVQEEKTVVDL